MSGQLCGLSTAHLFEPATTNGGKGGHSNPIANSRIRRALAMCRGCPVRVACGELGDQVSGVGVWGGTYRAVRTVVKYRKAGQ